MKIVSLILSARMNSARLPGKMMMEIGGKPILGLLIERFRNSKYFNNLIVATTDSKSDDVIERTAVRRGVNVFRGSEDDVLGRVLGAAKGYGYDVIVRLTGDCPMNDPKIIDDCVDYYLNNDYDFVTTKYNYPMGLDCEILSTNLLEEISEITDDPADREHVTRYIWRNKGRFSGISLQPPPELSYPEYMLTIDEHDDFQMMEALAQAFRGRLYDVGAVELIDYLKRNVHMAKKRSIPVGF